MNAVYGGCCLYVVEVSSFEYVNRLLYLAKCIFVLYFGD